MISRLEGIFFSPKCIYFVHLKTLSRSTLSALCLPHSTKEFLILWEWNCKAKMIGRKRQGQAVELESCVSSLVKVTVSSKQRPIKLWNKLLEQTGRLARAALRATSGTNTEQDSAAGLVTLRAAHSRCPLMFLQTSKNQPHPLQRHWRQGKQIFQARHCYHSSNYYSAIWNGSRIQCQHRSVMAFF